MSEATIEEVKTYLAEQLKTVTDLLTFHVKPGSKLQCCFRGWRIGLERTLEKIEDLEGKVPTEAPEESPPAPKEEKMAKPGPNGFYI